MIIHLPSRPTSVCALLLALALSGCAGDKPKLGTLYQRLGADEGVEKIVADFALTINADSRINERFAKVDMQRFRRVLAEQICSITGGPCSYGGATMQAAHEGMKITNEEFDAFIGNLANALDQHEVAPADERELLFALKAMRGEVMEIKD